MSGPVRRSRNPRTRKYVSGGLPSEPVFTLLPHISTTSHLKNRSTDTLTELLYIPAYTAAVGAGMKRSIMSVSWCSDPTG